MEMRTQEELHDIVIIGGGISGLATALGLHKKGIKSVVLERSETLRNTGAAIAFFRNGWHAFDHLGVGDQLRAKSTLITEIHNKWVHKDGTEVIPISEEGLRCVKRSDIIDALADGLPSESIRFGCRIVAVETNPVTSFHAVHLADGSVVRTKILIGCDGSNSVVARTLELKPPNLFRTQVAQAVTSYANGHGLSNHFLYVRGDKLLLGRVPIDDESVYWIVLREASLTDVESRNDPGTVRDRTAEALRDCPAEVIEMVKRCDLGTLSLHRIRCHAPWHLALGDICEGTMAVAGDAAHLLHPASIQGAGTAIEDAVVLARCLAQEMPTGPSESKMSDQEIQTTAAAALRRYARERRWRILLLSAKSYLLGAMLCASWPKRLVCLVIFSKILGGKFSHTKYDCGHL